MINKKTSKSANELKSDNLAKQFLPLKKVHCISAGTENDLLNQANHFIEFFLGGDFDDILFSTAFTGAGFAFSVLIIYTVKKIETVKSPKDYVGLWRVKQLKNKK